MAACTSGTTDSSAFAASTIAAGWPRATSAALVGPDRAPTITPGRASATACDGRRWLPSSSPLARLTTRRGAGGGGGPDMIRRLAQRLHRAGEEDDIGAREALGEPRADLHGGRHGDAREVLAVLAGGAYRRGLLRPPGDERDGAPAPCEVQRERRAPCPGSDYAELHGGVLTGPGRALLLQKRGNLLVGDHLLERLARGDLLERAAHDEHLGGDGARVVAARHHVAVGPGAHERQVLALSELLDLPVLGEAVGGLADRADRSAE